MPSIIDRQISAYDDSADEVMHSHKEAIICREVQEFVDFGIAITDIFLQRPRIVANVSILETGCNHLINAMNATMAVAQEMADLGCAIDRIEEFGERLVSVRDLLAWCDDAKQPPEVLAAANARIAAIDYGRICSEAVNNQPPQSWFDEDHSGLGR